MLRFGIERIHIWRHSLSGKIMICPYVHKCAQQSSPVFSIMLFRFKYNILRFSKISTLLCHSIIACAHIYTYIHTYIFQLLNERWILNLPDFCRVSPLFVSRSQTFVEYIHMRSFFLFPSLSYIFFNNI